MGCQICKQHTINESAVKKTKYNIHSTSHDNHSFDDNTTIENRNRSQKHLPVDDKIVFTINELDGNSYLHVADPKAFNKLFIKERQEAVDNHSYRSAIQSWQPNSLQQLADLIRTFSKGKSVIDCYWIIFYWIAINIEYDVVSYFAKDYKDQTAGGVFRRKKGVCAGYANLYKYLCDQLEMACEIISGYAKGYGFDDREGAPSETDHAWNAVQIDQHWYLLDSTWGAGHLNDTKQFQRQLTTYYFLARPNEMIYHHLPEQSKWQLLQIPITMTQYMELPQVHPPYFELNLEIVNPRNQAHVDILPDKPYALVVIRAPSDVHLSANLKLNDQKVDGGHRVVFDNEQQLYYCYFAPPNTGKYKITIYGKQGGAESDTYNGVVDFMFNVTEMPSNPISFPKIWKNYFDLSLEVVSPEDTHFIELLGEVDHAIIKIQTPRDVLLHGKLQNDQGQEIIGGTLIYFDNRRKIWQCKFAPDQVGLFEALIMAKKKSDPGSYRSALSFKIDVKKIPSPPLSFPETWQVFFDLGLKIEAPINTANAVWPDNASYAELLIQAPDDVQLSCSIEYNNVKIENGSLAQFDHEKKHWQLLFAPQQTGLHKLIVYAKRMNDTKTSSEAVVKFTLNVIKLRQSIKFPIIYKQFQTTKCRIYTPLNGILKKGAVVPIHCVIPGATKVDLQSDSNWLKSEGYKDPILQRQITLDAKELTIYAKYGDKSNYDGLIKYTVQ